MPFSLWEYLRERTRDAVLAGFQDALDIVEQGDTNGSQHDAAKQLVSKLSGSRSEQETAEQQPKSLPGASMRESVSRAEAPKRPVGTSEFDDELEARLSSAAAQNGRQTPSQPQSPATNQTGRRRRGRPPKSGAAKT